MPIHEFTCSQGHTTEKLFLTFSAAEGVDSIPCGECSEEAQRVEFSVPQPGIFYGDGFYKPAPSGKTAYRNEDPDKAAREAGHELGPKGLKNLGRNIRKAGK